MSLLAIRTQPWPKQLMNAVRDNEAIDRRRKGLALRALRKRLGHTQETAAGAHGVTPQAWQNYEGGKRHLSDTKVAALVGSLGGDMEEFQLELSRIPDAPPPAAASARRRAGLEERSFDNVYRLPLAGVAHGGPARPDFSHDMGEAEGFELRRFFKPGTEVLQVGGMSMYPYAEPGGFVTYNRRDLPKRGEGCVIEMKDGSKLVKRFEHYDDHELVVTELWPEEKRLTFPLADVAGVYAIGLRGG